MRCAGIRFDPRTTRALSIPKRLAALSNLRFFSAFIIKTGLSTRLNRSSTSLLYKATQGIIESQPLESFYHTRAINYAFLKTIGLIVQSKIVEKWFNWTLCPV